MAAAIGVPFTTLQRHHKSRQMEMLVPPAGRTPSLPDAAEAAIANVARVAAMHGFGLQREELQLFICQYVKDN